MRLISSQLALLEVLALAAAGELTLSELARAVEASPSAVQRALEILLADGVAERVPGQRLRYRLRSTDTAACVLTLATDDVSLAQAAGIGARAHRSVELVARNDSALVVVFSPRSGALVQSRAAKFFDRLAARHALEAQYLDHDDVRRRLLSEPALRREMAGAALYFGEFDHTFPNRSQHGMKKGRPLHRPHPRLTLKSRGAVRAMAKRHGISSVWLFGSAVRSDFRPDSDVDVLIAYRPGVKPTLRSLIEVEHVLEEALEGGTFEAFGLRYNTAVLSDAKHHGAAYFERLAADGVPGLPPLTDVAKAARENANVYGKMMEALGMNPREGGAHLGKPVTAEQAKALVPLVPLVKEAKRVEARQVELAKGALAG